MGPMKNNKKQKFTKLQVLTLFLQTRLMMALKSFFNEMDVSINEKQYVSM